MGELAGEFFQVEFDSVTDPSGLEFPSFGLSPIGTTATSKVCWFRGDVQFSNISNVFGYIDLFQLCIKTEQGTPVNHESYRIFEYISKEIRKISRSYDDLCMKPSGAKVRGKTRMTTGIRRALSEGILLTGGGSPKRDSRLFIVLCGNTQS